MNVQHWTLALCTAGCVGWAAVDAGASINIIDKVNDGHPNQYVIENFSSDLSVIGLLVRRAGNVSAGVGIDHPEPWTLEVGHGFPTPEWRWWVFNDGDPGDFWEDTFAMTGYGLTFEQYFGLPWEKVEPARGQSLIAYWLDYTGSEPFDFPPPAFVEPQDAVDPGEVLYSLNYNASPSTEFLAVASDDPAAAFTGFEPFEQVGIDGGFGVPEPATLSLLVVGALAVARRRGG